MKALKTIREYDLTLFNRLTHARPDGNLVKLNRYISKTGDGHLYLLTLAWIGWSDNYHHPFFMAIFAGFRIERAIYFILKNDFKRNRPEAILEGFQSIIKPSNQFSFPSSHTSAAFMMAILCGYFFPALMMVLLGWAFLVGLSRVILGVHLPTDTLVGMSLGACVAIISLEIVLR